MSLTEKLKDYRSAIMNFEKALEKAKLVHDDPAQKAIITVSGLVQSGEKLAAASIS